MHCTHPAYALGFDTQSPFFCLLKNQLAARSTQLAACRFRHVLWLELAPFLLGLDDLINDAILNRIDW